MLTSIHIEEHEVEARSTKLGDEEITADIPNVQEEVLKDLDEEGIIRIGAKVKAGDVLVGQGDPQGRDRADRRGEAAAGDLRREGTRGARHLPEGAARRVRQGHRREDVLPQQGRRHALLYGEKKDPVTRAVMAVTNLDYKDAKSLVEEAPDQHRARR